MASKEEEADEDHQNVIIYGDGGAEDEDQESDEEDDVDDDEEEDDEEEYLQSHSPPAAAAAAAAAVPSPKRERITEPSSSSSLALATTTQEEKKPSASAFDDSRKLFQRLWTDEDEIGLLQGFLDYTSQRGGFKNSAYHHDTAPFYDQIKSRLQLDFNKNQLVEKLRRLKKKYRNVMNRITSGKDVSFKTPHDQATFEISRKIWSGIGIDDEEGNPEINHNGNHHQVEKKASGSRSRKRSRSQNAAAAAPTEENNLSNLLNCPVNSSLPNVIEDTVRSCLSPLFKELMYSAINGPANLRGFGTGMGPLNFGGKNKEAIDEKWRKQQILELEVYSKRMELVQDQIKLALEELRRSP